MSNIILEVLPNVTLIIMPLAALLMLIFLIRKKNKKELYVKLKKSNSIYPDRMLYDLFYSSSWASVTKCTACEVVGMYEDAHPVTPCKRCGARVEKCNKSAKFNYDTCEWKMQAG